MHRKTDSVRLRDEHPAVGPRAQELLGLRLEWIDRIADLFNSGAIECIFEHEKPALVERSRLLVADQTKWPPHRRPAESAIQRMKRGRLRRAHGSGTGSSARVRFAASTRSTASFRLVRVSLNVRPCAFAPGSSSTNPT